MFDIKTFRRVYMIGAVIVWVSIIVATSVLLGGTPHLISMLIILNGGAFWFVVIVPAALLSKWKAPESH